MAGEIHQPGFKVTFRESFTVTAGVPSAHVQLRFQKGLMKSYAIILSAALLSACAAESGSTDSQAQKMARAGISNSAREQCQRESVQMYPVNLQAPGDFKLGPATGPTDPLATAYGPHPSGVDSNADIRSKWVAECMRAKENEAH
jgi:hypothetical protein